MKYQRTNQAQRIMCRMKKKKNKYLHCLNLPQKRPRRFGNLHNQFFTSTFAGLKTDDNGSVVDVFPKHIFSVNCLQQETQ
ncbi:hypothetical protein HanHA89_Chr16g0642701 [Helianthus annuus]|nr:hypothetical protein HanHA89_Chr16g0642701 [Helianthus annuus]